MDLASRRWFKSSRSGSQSNCVEVAFVGPAVGVRDSKDRQGPALVLGAEAWRAFTNAVSQDSLSG
ncbi:MAG: DUF397 domain-containing protein [Actinocatenispora sp.]